MNGIASHLDRPVHTFYYAWWGNPATDGHYRHWNHELLLLTPDPDVEMQRYPGGDDIGASFYPAAGCYSSRDSLSICLHFRQMNEAGIDVAVISWWGQGSFEDSTMPLLLKCAQQYDLQIAIHLEPVPQRTALSVREDLAYLHRQYGQHPAWYKEEWYGSRPVYYVYDSYHVEPAEWARLLQPDGDLSIRGTELDALFISLLVEADERQQLLDGGFDGFYTYFGATGFSYGSTPVNWPFLKEWSEEQALLFVPCVAPGYDDTRVRPWNEANIRERGGGVYYDWMWRRAIGADPDCIGVTSFNEWHEGTQIEPALPRAINDFTYRDYLPESPEYYLQRTRHWSDRFRKCLEAGGGRIAPDCLPEMRELDNRAEHSGLGALLQMSAAADERYPGQGNRTLLDGKTAQPCYRDGRWQGFQEEQLELLLEYEQAQTVNECWIGFLNQQSFWIFPPLTLELAASQDGVHYRQLFRYDAESIEPSDEAIRVELGGSFKPQSVTILKVKITALESCPVWHSGAGQPPWLFIDEIIIR